VNVSGIDVANWLQQNFVWDDFVIVKMDIEGAEHHVLPHLATNPSKSLIDALFYEEHDAKWAVSTVPIPMTLMEAVAKLQEAGAYVLRRHSGTKRCLEK